jgi:hypothetical protein
MGIKDKTEIFKTIYLIGGQKVDFAICRGVHISRANYKYIGSSNKRNLDLVPFLMAEICLVDGKKKDVDYFLSILGDDYIHISEIMNELLIKLT